MTARETLARIQERIDTELILRDGDPFYDGAEASAYERVVAPQVVEALVAALSAVLDLCEERDEETREVYGDMNVSESLLMTGEVVDAIESTLGPS